MNKHIVGFILFSLILGLSLFTFGTISSISESISTVNLRAGHHGQEGRKRKKKKRRHRPHFQRYHQADLVQAVFDKKTGLFTPEFDSLQYGRRHEHQLDLHFYSKDGHGTRFLKTERMGNPVSATMSKEMNWLNRLDVDQNVYVVASLTNWENDSVPPPAFDSEQAVPVTLLNK